MTWVRDLRMPGVLSMTPAEATTLPAAGGARSRAPRVLFGVGLFAFLLSALSLAELALPRPWDGVVLEADAPGQLMVRRVVDGSGAQAAGIRPGDQIVGIDRTVLRSTTHAAQLLAGKEVGDSVPYLIRRGGGVEEMTVQLGRRWIGSVAYVYAAILGFLFFVVGLYVLLNQPRKRSAQVFFLLATLFMVFLVCRLRPASYSWIDSFVLADGMLALLLLPAAFLHFFLIFPRPVPLRPEPGTLRYRARRRRWLGLLAVIYLVPNLVLVTSLLLHHRLGRALPLVSGAPLANWWVLALYMLLGLAVLAWNARRVADPQARRGAALVFAGTLLGIVPFLVLAVAFPSFLHTERYLFFGVAPLVLIPLTFAYAIARFRLLDVKVILRKSLLYTATSAVVTLFYALGIALVNTIFRDYQFTEWALFPVVFALVIVLLFEPLRRGLQVLVDRFFSAERRHLQQVIRELGQALSSRVDLAATVRDLVERLPERLGIRYAALYLWQDDRLIRAAGPSSLPTELTISEGGREAGGHLHGLARLDRIGHAYELSQESLERLEAQGVELAGQLASARRRLGLVLLSGRVDRMTFEPDERELLEDLLRQAAIALETSLLLEERTKQIQLEQELALAATIQQELLPRGLELPRGWQVTARCLPASDVGGDFLAELPGPAGDRKALVYGDVAGKSVSGALVMMAAHEILHSLALADPDPQRLLERANRRLYELGRRRTFVAVGYLSPDGDRMHYCLAGQPPLLLRRRDGRVEELPLPPHHLPLGALLEDGYVPQAVRMEPGELLLACSDGVLEAQAPDGEPFGVGRLAAVIAAAEPRPEATLDAVLSELTRFTRGAEPYDDITLLAVLREEEVTNA